MKMQKPYLNFQVCNGKAYLMTKDTSLMIPFNEEGEFDIYITAPKKSSMRITSKGSVNVIADSVSVTTAEILKQDGNSQPYGGHKE